jgi:hypothetical protein
MLSRSLMNVALDGRVTFMAAGAVLGVGVYGFAVTFKPYESGRVLEPFHVPVPSLVASGASVFESPSLIFPQAADAAPLPDPPVAPDEVLVLAAPTVRAVVPPPAPAPAPVAAAGTGEGAEPLPPPAAATPPAPEPVGVQQIDPANVLVVMWPPRDGQRDEPADDDPPVVDEPEDPPPDRNPDGENDRSDSKDRGRKSKGGGPKGD